MSFVATKKHHDIYPVNENIRINSYDDYQPSILQMKTKAQETEKKTQTDKQTSGSEWDHDGATTRTGSMESNAG